MYVCERKCGRERESVSGCVGDRLLSPEFGSVCSVLTVKLEFVERHENDYGLDFRF